MRSLKAARLLQRNPSKTVSIHIPRLFLALIDEEARNTGKTRSAILKPILRLGLLRYAQIYNLSRKVSQKFASNHANTNQTSKAS